LLDDQPGAVFDARAIPRQNLPRQITSFVGREREIAEIRGLLETVHLLTLTGPGGTGKTRLSLQVASEVVEEYADGVYLVELASISNPELVANVISQALELKEEVTETPTESLQRFLTNKRMLLVLDEGAGDQP
jgi:predicted ATPase